MNKFVMGVAGGFLMGVLSVAMAYMGDSSPVNRVQKKNAIIKCMKDGYTEKQCIDYINSRPAWELE